MTTDLEAERRYADKLIDVLSRITPKSYDDVVRIEALIREHAIKRGK